MVKRKACTTITLDGVRNSIAKRRKPVFSNEKLVQLRSVILNAFEGCSDLIGLILQYFADYKSKEYILKFETCRRFGKPTWTAREIRELGLRDLTKIVVASGLHRVLKWGDVVRIEKTEYRNEGRSFWIDNQLIPFYYEYDDYGSIYPWMLCNKVGTSLCWKGTADGHSRLLFFDRTGYKIANITRIEDCCLHGYVATVANNEGDEWYVYGENLQDVKDRFQEEKTKCSGTTDLQATEPEEPEEPEEKDQFSERYNICADGWDAYSFDDAPRDFHKKYPQFYPHRLFHMF